ncbi:MAG: hypothetical protein GWN00_33520 [Aliifodinibius sp.]|nr:hypothetical protein [candidate division Zixibacteria bacterium]NIT60950.1 hypothetical protein [Fodinibius sp.]NIW40063.1 hypothetical protein [candidate division Zixibacteria bacterium]NIX58928.1 hypothetical protein [candidate division Zixibacteria bacterium]NIY29531.1 hypothetical protein [Fodinibius sp.]
MKPVFALFHVFPKRMRLLLIVFALIIAATANISAQDLTSVTLNWTAPGDDGNVGQAAQYDVRYSTGPITNQNWNSAIQADGEPAPAPAGDPETFTISGLESNTTYYFAIKTADEAGNWSGLSNVAMVTTNDNVPPGDITDLTASSDQ